MGEHKTQKILVVPQIHLCRKSCLWLLRIWFGEVYFRLFNRYFFSNYVAVVITGTPRGGWLWSHGDFGLRANLKKYPKYNNLRVTVADILEMYVFMAFWPFLSKWRKSIHENCKRCVWDIFKSKNKELSFKIILKNIGNLLW